MRNIGLNIAVDCSVMVKMNWEGEQVRRLKETTHLGEKYTLG